MGAMYRLWLRFDLGSSFQLVLTSQSCEESQAGSLQREFSLIQYLQGMRKWEHCNRRHHTLRFQLFLTAFMKIEAQWGV